MTAEATRRFAETQNAMGLVQLIAWVPERDHDRLVLQLEITRLDYLTNLIRNNDVEAIVQMSEKRSLRASDYATSYNDFVNDYARALFGGPLYNQCKVIYDRYYDELQAYQKLVDEAKQLRRLTGKNDDLTWRKRAALAYISGQAVKRRIKQVEWVIGADQSAEHASNMLLQQREREWFKLGPGEG